MTRDEFTEKVIDIREMLYRVSFSILPNPHDQDDAVQECIKKALIKRESLRQDIYFKTWIIRILINECYSVLKRRKREVLLEDVHAVLPPTADVELVDSLMGLDVKLRIPFILSYIEGYTNKEISSILKMPEGTVKWNLSKARKELRGYWNEGRAEA